jgi:diguanylate cyclase (GGDEF)-like protein
VAEPGAAADFECVLANPGAHTLLELEPGALEGRNLREVDAPHASALLTLFRQVARNGGGEDIVMDVNRSTDEPRWFQVSASPVGDDISLTFIDITRERERQEAMAREAHQDALTGLLNRRGLEVWGARLLERTRKSGGGVGVIFLDLDRFKQINDQFGHARGDAILKAFARRLTGCVRSGDVVARFGGDEFVVVVQTERPDDLHEAAARINQVGERPYRFTDEPVLSRPSMGFAHFGRDGESLAELLKAADADMYRDKATRRS